MAGGGGEGAGLSPPGHPAVHQPGVPPEAFSGSQPKPLGDPGTVSLDEDVGPLHQHQRQLHPLRVLEVDHHRALPPVQHLGSGEAQTAPARTNHLDHLRPQVRQHHAGVGRRADPG